MALNKNNKKGDVINYLKDFIIAKGADFTHTSMGNPSQSYYIQTEDYDTFIKKYSMAIKNNEKLHITEKHKTISPILLDFDFKFNVIDNSNIKRLYSNQTIKDIIEIYTNVLQEYIEIDNYDIYVLEKSEPVLANELLPG